MLAAISATLKAATSCNSMSGPAATSATVCLDLQLLLQVCACLELHLQQYVHACSYFCNSTNLSKGESSVHEQGPLWRLVRASMTIVGMVPPVYYKGDLLVDGGYMNNIPVDVMRSMGVDTVRTCRFMLSTYLLTCLRSVGLYRLSFALVYEV